MRRLSFATMLICIAAPAMAVPQRTLETLVPGEAGSVVMAYDVAPSGDVENCVVQQSSGFADLDAASCRMMVRTVRFSPTASRQRASESIRWVLPRADASSQGVEQAMAGGSASDWALLNPQWAKTRPN